MVICLERGADLHMAQLMPLPLTVSCFSKIQISFTFLVPAHPGSPGKRAVKWVCVYIYTVDLFALHSVTIAVFILLMGDTALCLSIAAFNRLVKFVHFCLYFLVLLFCLQCFDAVGWVAGRASGL